MDSKKILIMIENNGRYEDKTEDIHRFDSDQRMYNIYFKGREEPYRYGRYRVEIIANPFPIDISKYIVIANNQYFENISELFYFKPYYKFFYSNGKTKVLSKDSVTFVENSRNEKDVENVIAYLKEVSSLDSGMTGESTNFLSSQLEDMKTIPKPSVLFSVIKKSEPNNKPNNMREIFPFSTNASQKDAVAKALRSGISFVQGPPGTGKTQTILNMIVNYIRNGKTVAVVSGNNEATKNVFEKLDQAGYGDLCARLGNFDNVESFFSRKEKSSQEVARLFSSSNNIEGSHEDDLLVIDNCQKKELNVARMKQELSEIEIESGIMHAQNHVNDEMVPESIKKKHYTSEKILELKAVLENLSDQQLGTFFSKLRILFRFGFLYRKRFELAKQDLIEFLDNKFYETKKEETESIIKSDESFLIKNHYAETKKRLIEIHKSIFDQGLYRKFKSLKDIIFDKYSYKTNFIDFTARYPVVLSTTHSLRYCSGGGFLYDVVIIDEATQADLTSAFLALSCAKNEVFLGDEMQLPRVIPNIHIEALNAIYNKYHLPEYFNYVKHSILTSVKQIFPNAPSTFLKEHYRSDPQIIGFCNKRFYASQLVLCKEHNPSNGIIFIKTDAHQERNRTNERQADEIAELTKKFVDPKEVGIIAPYRNQVDLLKAKINNPAILIDTVHKFQGKERSIIMLSTVSNKVRNETDRMTDFLDNENLINVAISRAKDKLFVLASKDILDQKGTLLYDFSRYQHYFCDETRIEDGKIYSVFDVMYKDYRGIFEKFKLKLKKASEFDSENVVSTLLDEVILDNELLTLSYLMHYPLKKIINESRLDNDDDREFVRCEYTHCDFVVFSILDHSIIMIIEVDGSQHKTVIQMERDQRKDRLLQTAGVKVVRYRTTQVLTREMLKNDILSSNQ